jgi:hypothetical protein
MSEIMYNPVGGTEYEFVELHNFGASPAKLAGTRFDRGVTYSFPTDTVDLEPGGYLVVVRNLAAFAERYGGDSGIRVVGPYAGSIADRGEEMGFLGALGERVFSFNFQNTWFPETDGQGRSLVLLDPRSAPETWRTPEAWAASVAENGSPGREDGELPTGRQIPGDATQDGRFDIVDVFQLLRALFQGGVSLPCGQGSGAAGNVALLDANGDRALGVADVIHALVYLFQAGPGPALGTSCVPIAGCPDVCGQ